MKMTWNYFGSRHGKGEHDGARDVVKRALTHKQLKKNSKNLTCANDVVNFLCSNILNGAQASYPSKEMNMIRLFWKLKVGEVDRFITWNCAPIPLVQLLHFVFGFLEHKYTKLKMQKLSTIVLAF